MFAPKTKRISLAKDPEVERVYNSLVPKPHDLISVPERYLVREGDLTVYEGGKSKHRVCRFFLFNDVMLQTIKESSKKWKLEIFINLRFGLQVGDVPDSTYKIPNVEFRLYTRQKTIFLFAISEEDKRLWLSHLSNCIDGSIDSVFEKQFLESQPPAAQQEPQQQQQQQQQYQQQQQQQQYQQQFQQQFQQQQPIVFDPYSQSSGLRPGVPDVTPTPVSTPTAESQFVSWPPVRQEQPPQQQHFQPYQQQQQIDDFDELANRAFSSTNPFASSGPTQSTSPFQQNTSTSPFQSNSPFQ